MAYPRIFIIAVLMSEVGVVAFRYPRAYDIIRQVGMLLDYNARIEFYGRVIDQEGKPLKGAKVSYKIQMAGDLQPQFGLRRRDQGAVNTRDDGTFEILKKKGMNLDISAIELDGYREAQGGTRRGYSYGSGSVQHAPDPSRPVEFLLIDTNVPKPLAKSFKLAFEWDAKPVSVAVEDSDVVIVFVPKRNRAPNQIGTFDWSLDLSVTQGEILRMPKDAPLIAPLDGYQKILNYGSLASDPKWSDGFGQESLVFRTQDGKYGRIELDLYVDREIDSTAAYVTVHLNPSGGRNLE